MTNGVLVSLRRCSLSWNMTRREVSKQIQDTRRRIARTLAKLADGKKYEHVVKWKALRDQAYEQAMAQKGKEAKSEAVRVGA